MRSWLHDGWLRFATVVDDGDRGMLATHGGLTRALWSELGSPGSVTDAASAISELGATTDGWAVLNRAGRMLNLGRFPLNRPNAGPIWAEASFELLPDWVAHRDMPFDQTHGHSSLFDWFRGRFRNPELSDRVALDREARHVQVTVGPARTITGIDPGLGRDGHARWAPLVV